MLDPQLLARVESANDTSRIGALRELGDHIEAGTLERAELQPVMQKVVDLAGQENHVEVQEELLRCLLVLPSSEPCPLNWQPIVAKLANDPAFITEYLQILYLAGTAHWPVVEAYRDHNNERVRQLLVRLFPRI